MYEYKERRNILLEKIGINNAAVFYSAKEIDLYRYKQDSDFYYLTGFDEPESIAVFIPGRLEGEFILFNRSQDKTKELWLGAYSGQAKACSEFGADQAFPIDQVSKLLPELLNNYNQLDVKHVKHMVHQMRTKKSQAELEFMQNAVKATTSGFLKAIKSCQAGMHEFELEAELLYEFKRNNGCNEAFPTIVGGGKNACILHYTKNLDKLRDGDLVLIDAGAEYKYYCADVSRTIPVNGKFSSRQRDIYDIVLNTQLEVINNIRPGVKFSELQLIAENFITNSLNNLGLLLPGKSCKSFFMHKIGHFLGLEVHDVGNLDVLEPGMVITIEPGIYIESENLGIRIEDDILVTEFGCEVLTQAIPKTILELEKIMNTVYCDRL